MAIDPAGARVLLGSKAVRIVDGHGPNFSGVDGAILVVDAAPGVRLELEEILAHSGARPSRIASAATAAEARSAFRALRPRVVLAELVGDDPADGLAMIVEMMATDPRARIVLVTAEEESSPLVRRAVRAGVFAVVRKPLRRETIRHVLLEIFAEEGGLERLG
jgi:DNA-binding NarL/FixJ family response regulator